MPAIYKIPLPLSRMMCDALTAPGSGDRRPVKALLFLAMLSTTGGAAARPVNGAMEWHSRNPTHTLAWVMQGQLKRTEASLTQCRSDPARRFQATRVVRMPFPNPNNESESGYLYGGSGTNSSTCVTRSPAELVALSLPGDELLQLIVGCPIICLVASGRGQPDLAGRGVCGFPSLTRFLSQPLLANETSQRSSFRTSRSCFTPPSSALSSTRPPGCGVGCDLRAPTTNPAG